jgi:hypothetical protein
LLGLGSGTIQGLIIPIIKVVICEGRGAAASAGGHGEKRGAADKAQNVVEAAIQVLRVLAERLPWPQYQNLLLSFLKVLSEPSMLCVATR